MEGRFRHTTPSSHCEFCFCKAIASGIVALHSTNAHVLGTDTLPCTLVGTRHAVLRSVENNQFSTCVGVGNY